MTSSIISQFQEHLLTWYQDHGRHDLPWQNKTAYHTWLSEIMLQQTQVKTVIPYYEKFIQAFPDVFHLAQSPIDAVLKLWSGLGYYRRAHNLHQGAKVIVEHHQGQLPQCYHTLQTLPGIGPSTAAAIASLSFNLPHAIFDGNVKRVLSRVFRIHGAIHTKAIEKQLYDLAQACMPKQQCQAYTQAIMDLGATCCKPKQPECQRCPMQAFCLANYYQETALLPTPTQKNKPKVQDYHFLAYFNSKGEILLQERKNQGIWPQLWCLPESLSPLAVQPQLEFKHILTHQTMKIQIHCQAWNQDQTQTGIWVTENSIKNYGLPQAISNQVSAIFAYVKHALR